MHGTSSGTVLGTAKAAAMRLAFRMRLARSLGRTALLLGLWPHDPTIYICIHIYNTYYTNM